MEPLVLTDKSVIPNDDLIFSIIGKNKIHWQKLMASLHEKYPDAQGQWNYYNDGKNWLFKMIRKKKTLFWIGILADTFRIAFYFGDKAGPLVESSDLPASIKDEYKNGQRFGKIRAISMRVETADQIENALKLADIKIKV
jgi:hypothetical protein